MLNDIVTPQSDIKQDRMATNRNSTLSLNDDLQELQATTTQLIKDQLEGFQTKLDAKELAQVYFTVKSSVLLIAIIAIYALVSFIVSLGRRRNENSRRKDLCCS